VEASFGPQIVYAPLIKLYGKDSNRSPERRYSPAPVLGTRRKVVSGKPDLAPVSTSSVERANRTIRISMRRTRLSNGFSPEIENHAAVVALNDFVYNLIKIHRTLSTRRNGWRHEQVLGSLRPRDAAG
jgi:hypothetical protein